jgi:phage internal scaffolding protein
MFVRSGFPFNYDTDGDSEASGLKCMDVTLTQQNLAADCDINTIVKRFHLTGQLPVSLRAPVYQDFDGIFDYQSAMNVLRAADEAFMQMPADIRARFHNDGQEFVEFCSDEKNRSEAEKLGLVLPPVKVEEPAPVSVRVVQDPPVAPVVVPVKG